MFEQSVHDDIVGESEGLIQEGTKCLPAHFVRRITGILLKVNFGDRNIICTKYRYSFEDLNQPINLSF